MTPFEYILPLVSVLVGLAIADISVSFNRLLRANSRVKWDWLTLLAAFMAILAVLDIWWMFYKAQEATFYQTLAGFLPLAAQFIILFLINAAALPDDVPKEGIKLKDFYEVNSPYLWILFTIYFFSIFATRTITNMVAGQTFLDTLDTTLLNLLITLLFATLIYIKNRWYHGTIIIVFLISYMSDWSMKTLSTT